MYAYKICKKRFRCEVTSVNRIKAPHRTGPGTVYQENLPVTRGALDAEGGKGCGEGDGKGRSKSVNKR